MVHRFRALQLSGAYRELRAWVASDDARAIQFAERFGLVYDCGPATGISTAGRDMNLHLWSRANEQRRKEGQAASGGTSG